MTANSFGSRATLAAGGGEYAQSRLAHPLQFLLTTRAHVRFGHLALLYRSDIR